jgi:hypothetical protein
MSTSPEVGLTMRERIFSSVDLPAPLRPMMPTTSPGSASKLTSLSAQIILSRPGFRPRRRAAGDLKAVMSVSRRAGWAAGNCPIR